MREGSATCRQYLGGREAGLILPLKIPIANLVVPYSKWRGDGCFLGERMTKASDIQCPMQ